MAKINKVKKLKKKQIISEFEELEQEKMNVTKRGTD